MERFEEINKLFKINKYLSAVIITVNILQLFLIGTPLFGISWIIVLLIYIIRTIISNKIDKNMQEDYNEMFERLLNERIED